MTRSKYTVKQIESAFRKVIFKNLRSFTDDVATRLEELMAAKANDTSTYDNLVVSIQEIDGKKLLVDGNNFIHDIASTTITTFKDFDTGGIFAKVKGNSVVPLSQLDITKLQRSRIKVHPIYFIPNPENIADEIDRVITELPEKAERVLQNIADAAKTPREDEVKPSKKSASPKPKKPERSETLGVAPKSPSPKAKTSPKKSAFPPRSKPSKKTKESADVFDITSADVVDDESVDGPEAPSHPPSVPTSTSVSPSPSPLQKSKSNKTLSPPHAPEPLAKAEGVCVPNPKDVGIPDMSTYVREEPQPTEADFRRYIEASKLIDKSGDIPIQEISSKSGLNEDMVRWILFRFEEMKAKFPNVVLAAKSVAAPKRKLLKINDDDE